MQQRAEDVDELERKLSQAAAATWDALGQKAHKTASVEAWNIF